MASVCEIVGTLTISNGTAQSAWLASKLGFGAQIGLVIYAPATLTGTVNVLVSPDEAGSVNGKLDVQGTIVVVGAGRAVAIIQTGWKSISLISSSNEAADRVFIIAAQMTDN